MIGFIVMILIMRKTNMQKEIKKYSVSGYIIYILPITIAILNIVLFLYTLNWIPLLIGVIILAVEWIVRCYDKYKLSKLENQ